MLHVAYLMPLLPLAGFVVLVSAGRRIGDPLAGWIATAAVAGVVRGGLPDAGRHAAACPMRHRVFVHNYFTWFHVGGLDRAGRAFWSTRSRSPCACSSPA